MSRIRRLSPFGPLFDKELRVAARRKRNYFLRVFYLGALLLILLMAYAASGDFSGGVTQRVQRQAELGYVFFGCFTFFSIVAMGVIGPVLTSTAIGSERLAKTLHVLLMTPLNTWQIVGGKLFSRLLMALMLMGLSLPVLALVRLLGGGVEVWQMVAAIAIATAVAMFSASIGLWISTLVNRAYAVILLSYGVMAVIYLFIPFVLGMLLRFGAGAGGNPVAFMYLMAAINPVFAGGVGIFAASSMPASIPWWPCVTLHVIGAAILTALAAWTLRRQQRREGLESISAGNVAPPSAGPALAVESPGETSNEQPTAPPVQVQGASAIFHRQVGDNPIRWRELRQPILARSWQRVVAWLCAIGVVGVVYLLFAIEGELDTEEVHIFFAVTYHAILWILSAVLSATLIANEKESDTWTLLLATPLAASRIVWGKLIGLLWRLRWMAALIVAHFIVFTLAGVVSVPSAVLVLVVTFSFNLIWMVTGLYLSLRLANVTVAVVINLLLGVALYGALPLAEAVLQELLSSGRFNGPYTGMLWPYYYLGTAIDSLTPFSSGRSIEILGSGQRVSPVIFLAIGIGASLVHVALAWVGVRWIIRRFDRIVGRAPQVQPLSPPPAGAQLAAG